MKKHLCVAAILGVICAINGSASAGTDKWLHVTCQNGAAVSSSPITGIGNSPFSVSVWAKMSPSMPTNLLWSYGTDPKSFRVSSGLYWSSGYEGLGVLSVSTNYDTGIQPDANLHNIVMTYDTSSMRFYIDGALVKTSTVTVNVGTGFAMIGRILGVSNGQPDMFVRDFRIYNTALTNPQIVSICNGGSQSYAAGPQSGFIAWIKMNEGSGNKLSDSSGNGWTFNAQPTAKWDLLP